MIESLALGMPVIAWNNGSTPEVVAHGETGFVVDTIKQAVEAVDRVAQIEPPHVPPNF
jgi:glycosyltransferase involved in cell wall biosynthesis